MPLQRGFTDEDTEKVLNYLRHMIYNMADVADLAEQVTEMIGQVKTPAPVG